METVLTRKVQAPKLLFGGPDIQRIQCAFIGFERVPKAFKFDDSNICDCPTKPIKFEICDNDTINMINENGHKHGNWIEFYDTGEIRKRKKYNNGQLVEGYLYNKQGEATYKLKEEAIETEPIERIK
jgi:hypothetical protein